jgi:hypothetical protein
MTTSNRSLKDDYFENSNRVGLCPCPFEGDPERDIAMWASPFTSMRAHSTASLSMG